MLYIPIDHKDVYRSFGLELLLTEHAPVPEESYLLFWRTTPCLMLGKYQNAAAEIDLDYARRKGIQLVRRYSGGGCIYTDEGGWQFSFIRRDEGRQIDFRDFIEPVVQAIRDLGIPAYFTGRNDLQLEGRKFSGNAQYRRKKHVVHHGSLLFDSDLDEMERATTPPRSKLEGKGVASVRERVCNLRDHLPPAEQGLSREGFRERMVLALAGVKTWRELPIYHLTEEERAEADELGRRYFASEEAIWGKDPFFTQTLHGRFPGGELLLKLNVRHGRIEAAKLEGDFFSTLDPEAFNKALFACPYRRGEFRERLEREGFSQSVYRISADELASLIPEV